MWCQLHFHEVKNNGWFSNDHLIFNLVMNLIFIMKIGEPVGTITCENKSENQLQVLTSTKTNSLKKKLENHISSLIKPTSCF